jgi:hypothetical protein
LILPLWGPELREGAWGHTPDWASHLFCLSSPHLPLTGLERSFPILLHHNFFYTWKQFQVLTIMMDKTFSTISNKCHQSIILIIHNCI